MVLEILINPQKVTGKPWEMFFIGAMYSLVGVLLGYWVFRSHVSLVMVTFTSLAAIPFIHHALKQAEQVGQNLSLSILQKHGQLMSIFTFLFLGFVTVFFVLFAFLPQAMVSQIFQAQIGAIADVRNIVQGSFTSLLHTLGLILVNNLRVLVVCLIFSVVYGAGAIFILAWNASVMGAAIGSAIRVNTGTTFQAISSGVAGYFVHGIPEILAYFIGGLAGGILSMAIVREGVHSPAFWKAARDSLHLSVFALLLLVAAAFIEVFISPTIL